MAENDNDQEKTESATPRKREDAREEGKIPKSVELTTAMVLLGAGLAFHALGPAVGRVLAATMRSMLMLAGSGAMEGTAVIGLLQGMGWKLMAGTSALLLAVAGIASGTAAVQARGVLTMQPLQPKLERLNPLPQLKNFLSVQPWVELLKSLLKLLIVGVVVWKVLSASWADSIGLAQTDPLQLMELARTYVVKLLLTAGGCYLAFASADYAYQVWSHEKRLRMSKQEVKDESKQNEGDPMLKARIRAVGRSRARRQMFKDVPHADVVITNPTHIAVALKYDPALSDAPVVLAMGQRKVAERIKQIAREHDVPTVENRPLARALLASARVGTAIPPELYMAVAEVLAWVIGQRGRLRNVRA
ncbi:MAG TPA: flagellar biosynthesis protein FlhB [Longimicrobiaceae bacterium]|nr:flagellar biosynthesis protein FlhB [Longimicrobiaceae bacterium]